ncbi:hypothetical protein NDU88_001517, partial [Pleurodeles waltl]
IIGESRPPPGGAAGRIPGKAGAAARSASRLRRGRFLPEGVLPRPLTRGGEQKEGRPSAGRRLRAEDSAGRRAAAQQPVAPLGEAEGEIQGGLDPFILLKGRKRIWHSVQGVALPLVTSCSFEFSDRSFPLIQECAKKMRQLKGKPKKESSKDKKERKQAMQEARQQITTVVLPTLAIVVALIVVFVYVATRPSVIQ